MSNEKDNPSQSLDSISGRIIDACRQGDRDAQRQVYEATYDSVYRLMVRMVGRQDASDLTQQAFLQGFRKIDQFCGRASFGTWLYRVATNEALQHLRRSNRLQTAHLSQEPMDPCVDKYDNIDDKELLERALARLEPELRAAFLLREIEGLPYNEIAQVLQIPGGTVGSRLNRARRELKKLLIELGWEP
jgi:RNA polymerase sigma-70 factor (ECF subfamily)